ncbi:hypothetical protein [Geopseudomonas aromaticivorans]
MSEHPDAPEQYTLTLSAQQAAVLQHAMEVYARLGMGQVDDALRCLPAPATVDICERAEVIREVERQLAPVMRGPDGRLPPTSPQSKSAWDLYQVIRHRLAWDRAYAKGILKPGEPRRWSEMFGCQYDEPLPSSGEPLARMEPAATSQQD